MSAPTRNDLAGYARGEKPDGRRRGEARRSHLERALPLALLLLATGLLGGCGLFGSPNSARSVERRLTLNRETPEGTYEYFKEMAARGEFGAEWDTFSPNFKRMLNQAVGRNVDVADYNLARQTIATNSQKDMQLLLASSLSARPDYQNDRVAFLTIQDGAGRTVRPRMIKLTKWELYIRGESDPYSDFIRSAGEAVQIGPDGSITARITPPGYSAGAIRTFTPDQIESFKIESRWYVDDFGGLNQLVGESAQGGGQGNQPQPQPQPSAPGGGSFGSPDGGGSFGSPDGGGFGSPDGGGNFGSPDGFGSPG